MGREKIEKAKSPYLFSSAYISVSSKPENPLVFVFGVDMEYVLRYEEGFNFRIYEKRNPKVLYQSDLKKNGMHEDFGYLITADKKVVKNFLKIMSSPKTLVFSYNLKGKEVLL